MLELDQPMRVLNKGKVAALGVVSVGAANQAISSLTNFFYGLYLLRVLTLADFGRYSIGFATMLFLSGFANVFFLIQMIVHSPAKPSAERRLYAGRIFLMLAGSCLVLLALAASTAWGLLATESGAVMPVIGVALMSVAYMLKEFHTRHAFNESRGGRAVLIQTTVAVLMLLGIAVIVVTDMGMSLELAFGLYAGAYGGAALLGHGLAGLPMRGHSILAIKADLAEISAGGRWAVLTNLVYFLRSHAHTIVVTWSMGMASLAQVNAARILVAPAILIIPAMGQVVLPRIAAAADSKGWPAALKIQGRIAAGMLAFVALYSAALLLAWPVLSEIALGEKYPELFGVSALWCVYASCLAVRVSAEWAVWAMKMFRPHALVSVSCAPVALVSAWALAGKCGLEGAVLGVISGELVMVAGVYYLALRGGGRGGPLSVARSPRV
jgi:O-antigen/teichoic acid export membrane protein